MVKNDFILGNRGGSAVLITGDVVGEYITPSIMWIVGNITSGVLDDTGGPDGADVMAFAVIVPRDYLGVIISVSLKMCFSE